MRLEFHLEALAEVELAAQYYESRRPALGGRFIDAVESALGRIVESHHAWLEVEHGLRRFDARLPVRSVLQNES
jgi:hypothetical protein